MSPDFQTIHKAALTRAWDAAITADAGLGPEAHRGLDCGFAWVQITPGNHPFVRWLKAQNIGSKHYAKGWQIWGSRLHGLSTQSISVHEAASRAWANAVRESLKLHNMAPEISVGTRYD